MAPATQETLTEVRERLDQLLLQLMDDLEVLKEKREQLNSLIEKVENIESGQCGKGEETQEIETIGAMDQVLRLRGHKSTTETPKPTKSEGNEKQKPLTSNDPLRWFGVLVPQSLRQAQSTFRLGIVLAAEVASLQNSIDETRSQFRALLTDKHRLQAQSVVA